MSILNRMNNKKKADKGLWLTLVLSAVIVILAGTAFLPTIIARRSIPEATVVSADVDAEAVRVLGCCDAYTAANAFTADMTGTVKASVLGVPYTQKIYGSRTVERGGEGFTQIAESTSALVKAAVKRQQRDGKYYVSRGSYKNKSFSYGDEQELSKSNYIAQFGQPFTGVIKYCLSNSIISAQKIDDNTYSYVLDPAHSTVYTRNEVKTTLGGSSYPEYKSVRFTLTTDGERPIRVVCTEKFKIDKFGGTNCTAEYTETFTFAA